MGIRNRDWLYTIFPILGFAQMPLIIRFDRDLWIVFWMLIVVSIGMLAYFFYRKGTPLTNHSLIRISVANKFSEMKLLSVMGAYLSIYAAGSIAIGISIAFASNPLMKWGLILGVFFIIFIVLKRQQTEKLFIYCGEMVKKVGILHPIFIVLPVVLGTIGCLIIYFFKGQMAEYSWGVIFIGLAFTRYLVTLLLLLPDLPKLDEISKLM